MSVLISLISEEEIKPVLDFILPYETHCVNLAAEIISGAKNCYAVKYNGTICGAFCLRNRRTVFFCLPFTEYKTQKDKIICQESQKAFYDFFADEKPFCINGEVFGSLFLKNIMKNKTPSVRAKVVNEYFLMTRALVQQPQGAGGPQQKGVDGPGADCKTATDRGAPPSGTPGIFLAAPSDADALFPLEKAYQSEEVIPAGFDVEESLLQNALRLNLKTQKIFVLESGGGLCAKAAVTAQAQRSDLIGGVYTLPQYRRKGFAKLLVSHILQELSGGAPVQKPKGAGCGENPQGAGPSATAALYVKKNNAAACALYKSLGFEERGEYRIIYF